VFYPSSVMLSLLHCTVQTTFDFLSRFGTSSLFRSFKMFRVVGAGGKQNSTFTRPHMKNSWEVKSGDLEKCNYTGQTGVQATEYSRIFHLILMCGGAPSCLSGVGIHVL